MRRIDVQRLKPGMVVAVQIRDANNKLLIGRGRPITESNIEWLTKNEYTHIYIETELTKDINCESIIPDTLKYQTIDDMKKLNIDATINNAMEILSNVKSTKEFYIDPNEVRNKDNYFYQHSIAVAQSSIALGIALGLNPNSEEIDSLAKAALLHDIGKLCQDSQIMIKKGIVFDKFDNDYEESRHPEYGVYLLSQNFVNSPIKPMVKSAIMHHHVNEDLTGYPTLKSGVKQNLFAKIIHVADAYDNESYRKSPSEAMEFLMAGYGTLFNRTIVSKFIEFIPVYSIGTVVRFSNGWIGIVIGQNQGQPLRPKVRIILPNSRYFDCDLSQDERLLSVTIVGIDDSDELLYSSEIEENSMKK